MFHAVMNWVKHCEETGDRSVQDGAGAAPEEKQESAIKTRAASSREVHLPDMLQYVRLPLLSAKFLTDVVDEEVSSYLIM